MFLITFSPLSSFPSHTIQQLNCSFLYVCIKLINMIILLSWCWPSRCRQSQTVCKEWFYFLCEKEWSELFDLIAAVKIGTINKMLLASFGLDAFELWGEMWFVSEVRSIGIETIHIASQTFLWRYVPWLAHIISNCLSHVFLLLNTTVHQWN